MTDRQKLILIASTAVIAAVSFFSLKDVCFNEPQNKISTMENYVSRYQPGHLSSDEALELFRSDGRAVLLDLQSEAGYGEYRVTGAANVFYEELPSYAAENLPDTDRVIICYCFCGDMGGTALAAQKLLTELGYTNVYYAEPGDGWEFSGTSVAQGDVPPDPDAPAASGHVVIGGEEAKKIFDAYPNAILLDVRNRDEYDESHISGSVLIPVSELESRLSELPDAGAPIIVYCRAGVRSASAWNILSAHGYSNVYDMQSVFNWPGGPDE